MWSLLLLLVLFAVYVSPRPSTEKEHNVNVDFRYNDSHSGVTKLCVFCMQVDFERYGGESQCADKIRQGILPPELKEWNGEMKTFYPVCGTLQTAEYPRYIKNCTAAPDFPGVEVNCKDQHGRQLYRVHDTCRVKCTEPRMSPLTPLTTCDAVTLNWTSVTCEYHSCAPLSEGEIVERNENSTCDVSMDQPVNTSCAVTCPVGYDPPERVVECRDGQWELVTSCAPIPPKPPPATGKKSWVIPVSVCLVGIVIIAVLVLFCVWKQRNGCGSSSSVSTEDKKEKDDSGENDSLIGSSVSGESVAKDRTNSAAEHKGSTASQESVNSRPPEYTSVTSGGGYEMEKLLGADAACSLEFYYKINDELPEKRITESGVRLARGTLLTVLARCKNGHPITQFNYGPFFKNDRLFAYGISVVIANGDEGMYILAAQCNNGGQDMRNLPIQITDVTGNPEHTEPKYPVPSVHLESLDRSLTEPPIIATSEPSQSLKALPDSLPSNPNLAALAGDDNEPDENAQPLQRSLADLQRGGSSKEDEERSEIVRSGDHGSLGDHGSAAGARGGCRERRKKSVSTASIASQLSTQENPCDPDGCTLPLITLRTDQSLKESLDRLCELLQPLDKRHPDLTIQGLIFHTLGYSQEKLEHIIWAKRENLRESPARVLLVMMMQAGKKASDVIQYFSKHRHQHHPAEVIQILQRIPAHRNCPVCHS